jgi:predicted  nucleic acid-binding Zn-ribbon protein
MEMSEIFDKLKELQVVLAEKYEIKDNVDNLPKSLNSSMEGLEQFKTEFLQKHEECEAEKAKIAQLKSELDEAIKASEESEKGMDNIQTHREYEILNKQIDEAKAKETELRNQIAKEEKILSQLNDDVSNLEALINSTESSVNEEKAELDDKIKKNQEELEKLEEQEKQISEGIDPETLYKFQRIIIRNTKGIVAVKGNVCEGCQMILPAQFANEVRKGDKIMFCPYCSRILFYEEGEDSEENFFTIEETGSLTDFGDEDDLLDDEDTDSEIDGDEDSSGMDFDDN